MTDSTEKRAIRRAFEHAHHAYDRAASVQREIADHLLALSQPHIAAQPATVRYILDAGCGTGYSLQALKNIFPGAHRIGIDLAQGMLSRCQADIRLCGDLEALPCASESIDLYWSSLAWQWVEPRSAIAETARVLRPGGICAIATLGPQTLYELREAFAGIDSNTHVRPFIDPANYPAWLSAAGLDAIGIVRQRHSGYFANLQNMLHSLKALGAHHIGAGRRRTPLGKRAWQQLQSRYEDYRTAQGLPASYDVVYLLARRS